MNRAVELIAYDPAYEYQTAQAFLEVFTASPYSESLTLNDAVSQIQADSERDGFGGVLIVSGDSVIGFSWWFDISGAELNDRWRSRFAPKELIPRPEGHGALLNEFGVLASARNRGLGHRLLQATLEQIEPTHDWIAMNARMFAHAGLALLKSYAFEDLGVTGIQVPTRICLIKTINR
jgi:GNAT superfamily N-acetyltransferase